MATRHIWSLLKASIGLSICGAVSIVGIFYYYSKDLPKIGSLTDYRPPLITSVYADGGELIGEYFIERRKLATMDRIPQHCKDAFVAAEDSDFYRHPGINPAAIARAMVKNIKAMGFVQGGSTITQQVTKQMLLSSEKKIARKIKEAILAVNIENNLTKDEILYIYLNQIYLGHGAYGLQAAAENYFDKDVEEMTVAECSIIAGLPQAPSRYSPATNFEVAKERQGYVLRRMVEEGFVDKATADAARVEELVIKERYLPQVQAPFFAEQVRKDLIRNYGEDAVYREGLKIYTTVNLEQQRAAQVAIKKGLRELDRRIGYRGAKEHLETDEAIAERRATQRKALIAEARDVEPEEVLPQSPQPPLVEGEIYEGVVISAGSSQGTVAIGDHEAVLPLREMRWARKPNPKVNVRWARLRSFSSAFSKGDVIKVRPVDPAKRRRELDGYPSFSAGTQVVTLEQEPLVESGLVSMDPYKGYVRALVGGYDFHRNQFNRAIQAVRQPGSAFKGILYTAALDKGYTPATIIVDQPIISRKRGGGDWKPQNYSEKFYGPMTLWEALILSRNLVSIRILRDIGVAYAIYYARKMGIESHLAPDLSLALGSSGVRLMEMTRAFSVFPTGGYRTVPTYIYKVVDRDGNVLEDNRHWTDIYEEKVAEKYGDGAGEPGTVNAVDARGRKPHEYDPEMAAIRKQLMEQSAERGYRQAISPQTAFIMTKILEGVVTSGTAGMARKLGRPSAGKTGTTNDAMDTWYIGFTPNLLTGVWVGYDELRPLGSGETGGHTALPIWLYYMKEAVKDMPRRSFHAPSGITYAMIDADNGKLASQYSSRPRRMAFKSGTAPIEMSRGQEIVPEESGEAGFFRMDDEL